MIRTLDLISILYEVKNTFDEQHTYIFKLQKTDQLIEHTCKKNSMCHHLLKWNVRTFLK